MPLTDTAIRNAKPADKARKLFDGGGLYLEVAPSGGKWWRLKYRYGGKEKRLSLGVYPDVSLKDARERRDEARKLLANDIDPSEHRQAQKAAKEDRAANSFEVVAREWHAKHQPSWTDKHAQTIIGRLELNVFPWLGGKPIADITAPQLLQVIRRIEERGALETAHRVLGCCGQVFRYAVATGRAERDPSGDLRGALPPVKSRHFAAVTEPDKIAAVLRAIDGYEGTLPVRCALRLAPLVFVRPGELRKAEWADIDLDAAEWRYTVTKTNTPHIVPLSRQAVAILRELQPLTGRGCYVFPSARSATRPMSDNAVLAALRRMGIGKDEMSGHGFRAMARTILDEVLGFRPDYIEHQLAHAVRDPNGRAYNRTAHLTERRNMMQAWADYLDKLKSGAEVIPLHKNQRASPPSGSPASFHHYVPLPTTDPGWAGSTRSSPKPQTIGGGKAQRRAGARQAGRQPSLPVAPRKRQRREPRPAEAAEPVAQQPAVPDSGTAQPAAEPQALGPVFRGEGRRGGARAITEGPELERSHGASLPELAEAVWRP